MYDEFKKQYEAGLQKIKHSIETKYGIKKYDKVNQRIGSLKQKYPSVHSLYNIELDKDEKDICTSMKWQHKASKEESVEDNHGVYFIRTSLRDKSEIMIWEIYNCIREVESSFRCLKTDLELRPIYHKTDEAGEAHIHLGLLAYWLVSSIRYQLKKGGIHSEWREIVRVMNTQKCVTTTMTNDKNENIVIRLCSQPIEKVKNIYSILNLKEVPFIRKKSVVYKM